MLLNLDPLRDSKQTLGKLRCKMPLCLLRTLKQKGRRAIFRRTFNMPSHISMLSTSSWRLRSILYTTIHPSRGSICLKFQARILKLQVSHNNLRPSNYTFLVKCKTFSS